MQFSSRLPQDLSATPIAAALDKATIDLTLANPTEADLNYEATKIITAFSNEDNLIYDPHALGAKTTRDVVAKYLGTMGRRIASDRLALTASTSEAYSIIFKLLCNPGDSIAMPAPSYPLVPHLLELEALNYENYKIDYDTTNNRWQINFASLKNTLNHGARAIVVISPNNPTGNTIDHEQALQLAALAKQYNVALIIDEVFAPYGVDGVVPSAAIANGPLTFVLDGLSKSTALPQMKLAWIAAHGSDALVIETMLRLEWLLDAYLSVSAPILNAAPKLLETAIAMQHQIRTRLQYNYAILALGLKDIAKVQLLAREAGWYAIIKLPQSCNEEALVTKLANEYNIKVQPGYFFDFADEGYLVVSLLVEPKQMQQGVAALQQGLVQLL
ncbi:MAG: pyridoxal phosphate-dependent aminotransferase [Deltaproteobacteria bacterium]|nr:pyridoxal phosphate-dependent aminotransferase [Deltaproteobacteria bacterium]